MKKAYLVEVSLLTRVIAHTEEEAEKLALINIKTNPDEYLIRDNIEKVERDLECPFETSPEDREEPCFAEINVTDDTARVRVTLEYIGEGYNGDYDPNDPDDNPLIRFCVDKREPGDDHWESVEDASYCTQIPISTPREQLTSVARSILLEVSGPVLDGHSIKKLCERLSWIEV